jgi:hypothetical protein
MLSGRLSGRWLLTLISGLVFAYCSITGLLKAETISAIISLVFVSYFQKERKP